MESIICMCVDWKGSGKHQPEGKCITWCQMCITLCQNKCLQSDCDHQRQRNKWWCCLSCRYIQATIHAFTQGFYNSSTNNVFVAHLPQATAFLICFGQWRPRIAFIFYRLEHPTARFIYVALTTNLDYFACIVNMVTQKIMYKYLIF